MDLNEIPGFLLLRKSDIFTCEDINDISTVQR